MSRSHSHSEPPCWADAPAFGRRETLLRALRRLYALHPASPTIVETGTLRDDRENARFGDGWSTLAWGWYASQTGGRATTVDIDPDAIEVCRKRTKPYASSLDYIAADSLAFLRQWQQEQRGPIHLLYLDSLDYSDPERSEQHHLLEAQAALPSLAPACLVLFDDTEAGNMGLTGKGARAIPYLLEQGFTLEWVSGGQALLSRGGEDTFTTRCARDTEAQRMHTEREERTAIGDVPAAFAEAVGSAGLREYMTAVARLCQAGSRTCEIGSREGYAPIWLSQQGIEASGMGTSAQDVEYARQVNNVLGGRALFEVGDPLNLFDPSPSLLCVSVPLAQRVVKYRVLHHQGLLHRLHVVHMRAMLARQVAMAEFVVFSVPSVYHPPVADTEQARLLPIELWRQLLGRLGFEIAELRYFGAKEPGGREHILCELKGQPVTEQLLAQMQVPEMLYPEGISAVVLTRNEERHIAACLQSLAGWTDEILVCDMESTDSTVALARQVTDQVLSHPLIPNFDQARNAAALFAGYRWVFFLDADERVPPGLGPRLRRFLAEQGDDFSALALPFTTFVAGKEMTCLAPGYKAPPIYKNGCFFYNARPHQGAQVEGRIAALPADGSSSLLHYSYDSFAHYLEKMNRYTDTEAANRFADGQAFSLQAMFAEMFGDMRGYYDGMGAHRDGPHGLFYTLLSGVYRMAQYAKLYEQRFQAGVLSAEERAVPQSLEELLEFALHVARQRPQPDPPAIRVDAWALDRAEVVWSGPLYSPSGYGEESRHFLLALSETGIAVSGHPLLWKGDGVGLETREARHLNALLHRPVAPGFVQIVQSFAPGFEPHPEAGLVIGRTMFETDRLPPDWVDACNRMDYVWVPSEFNKETFALSGVAREKLVVVPGCFDPAPYQKRESTKDTKGHEEGKEGKFVFLSVFDWTLHKGWDLLLKGFARAFAGRADVELVLKVWSSLGYTEDAIREMAAGVLGESKARVQFVFERLSSPELIALYHASDAFVLPSRGEGWGRPYMEAMACGLPTIGTDATGNTEFMTFANSYLLDCRWVVVPEAGWQEIPAYRGHRWAEPDLEHLVATLQEVIADRAGAWEKGDIAREEMAQRYSRAVVGAQMAEILFHHRGHRGTQRKAEEEKIESTKDTKGHEGEGEEFNKEGRKPGNQEKKRGRKREMPAPLLPSPLQGNPREKSSEGKEDLDSLPIRGFGLREARPVTGRGVRVEPSALQPSSASLLSVRWEGALFSWHSLAQVNREMCLQLVKSGKVEISLVSTEAASPGFLASGLPALTERVFAPLSGPAVVHVRHGFPPRFDAPHEGHLVLMQPWEFGSLPARWIAPIRENVAEVWCYSQYVKEVYRASGVPEEKLAVVTLGVDTEVFTPDAPPYVFTTEAGAKRAFAGREKPFVFLFVGGTIYRKGIDILLDAYLRAFSACDEVCLVVKDTGTRTVYRGMNQQERLLQLAQDPSRPAVVYLDEDLPARVMAGLYTAADCLVLPYRGEGFCLPALEAMSCGRPVLVTKGGPTDDFVDERVGWPLPAQKLYLPDNRVGDWECVERPWLLEVDADVLARKMRQIVGQKKEIARRGEAAARRVRAGWSWQQAGERAMERLKFLAALPPPQRVIPHPISVHAIADASGKAKFVGEETEREVESAALTYPRISLCMIVKDEERVLGACLESAKAWMDEIIVVDTGSKDRTVEIAQKAGARVEHFDWCEDFSAARNESLKYATGDWIFWLDADDTLPYEAGEAIRQAVLSAPADVVGFIIPVQFVEGGQADGTRVDHVKLFRNLPGLAFEGRIHEQIVGALKRTGGRLARCNALVLHTGYDTSPEGQAKKRERDSRILALERAERPDHPFVLFCDGMTDHYGDAHESAIRWLTRCLEVAAPSDSIVRKAYALLAVSQRKLGRLEESEQTLLTGLNVVPDDPELHFHLAQRLSNRGEYAEARRHYEAALQADISDHFSSVDMGILGFKTFHNLAGVCLMADDYPAAREWWQKAIAQAPQFLPSAFDLFRAALQAEDYATAEQVLERIRESEGANLNFTLMSANYALARGEKGQAETTLRQALAAEGGALPIRMALARHLLKEERVEEAQEHLVSLSEAGNAEAAYYLGVAAVRAGDYPAALNWMERSRELNPEHEPTVSQIVLLRQAIQEEQSVGEDPASE